MAVSGPAGRDLAFVGTLQGYSLSSLAAQAADLDAACARFRYFGYPQVELAVDELAQQLHRELGEDLNKAVFCAVPRGGLVVLGLLASRLGLAAEQVCLAPYRPNEVVKEPLVLVDDCALSGRRLATMLDGESAADSTAGPSPRIFACLAAPAELRRAALASDSRLDSFLLAVELEDHAAQRSSAWRERWLQATPGRRYWIGQPEVVAFPWGEPDRMVWNEAESRPELGWRLAPPERCAKNHPGSVSVQVCPTGPGPLALAPGVIIARLANEVVLGNAGQSQGTALHGSGATWLQALIRCGSVEAAADQVAEHFGLVNQPEPAAEAPGQGAGQASSVRNELLSDGRELVQALLSQGLLQELP